MKRLIYLVALVAIICSFATSQTNNINITLDWEQAYRCTLTTAIDTLIVRFSNSNAAQYDSYTISVKSSAVDTFTVETQSVIDTTIWVQKGLINLYTDSDESTIAATTTWKEYIVLDPRPSGFRVIGLSDDGSTCILIISGKQTGGI